MRRAQNLQDPGDEQDYSAQGSNRPWLLYHPARHLHHPSKLLHVPDADASHTLAPSHPMCNCAKMKTGKRMWPGTCKPTSSINVLWLTVSGVICDGQHTGHPRTSIPASHSNVPNWFWPGLIWLRSNWQVEIAQRSEHSITMRDYISFSWRRRRQPVNDSGTRVILSWTWSLCLHMCPQALTALSLRMSKLQEWWSIYWQVGWQAGRRWLRASVDVELFHL